jgi:hypothetical protein
MRVIACCVRWARTTTLKDLVKHATDVQKLKLKVNQVVMRVFQASTKMGHQKVALIARQANLPMILTLMAAVPYVQLDIMRKTLVRLTM